MSSTPPDALLFLSGQCPHCPAVLAGLGELLKRGLLGRLEAVNLEAQPGAAADLGVRAVPWLRLGPYVLSGTRNPAELETWARRAADPAAMADAFHDYLKQGNAARVLIMVGEDPARLAHLLPILANPDASLNVRLGAGMVLEEHAGSPALAALLPGLADLVLNADARVRADAAHVLGLTRAAAARPELERLLGDADAEVREIAADGLASL
ncbi:MAG: HEAT repeat domain-containing protein [Pseudomonadota bacterium]